MSVMRNWLGAEFLLTPPACGGSPSARRPANIDPSAAAPATLPNMPRRVTPGLGFDIGFVSSGSTISGYSPFCQSEYYTFLPLSPLSLQPKLSGFTLSLIHISEPTRLGMISYAVF